MIKKNVMQQLVKKVTIYLLIGASTYGAEDPKVEDFFKNLNGIQEILQRKDEITSFNDKTITVFVGATGAGKSTLLNILAGEELRAVESSFNIEIVAKDSGHELIFPIGNGQKSCTSMPKIWNDEKRKMTLCDCPGFFDNRSFLEDITRAYLMQPLIENEAGVKVVFLAPLALLTDRGNKSFDSLVKLKEILDLKSFDQLSQSMSLIVTRFKSNKSPEDIINLLKNDAEGEKFFQGLMLDSKHIGVVDEIGEGDITEGKYCRNVREAITNSPLLHIPRSTTISLVAETQNQLNALQKDLATRIRQWLNDRAKSTVQQISNYDESSLFRILASAEVLKLQNLPSLVKNADEFGQQFQVFGYDVEKDSDFIFYKSAMQNLGYLTKDFEIATGSWISSIVEEIGKIPNKINNIMKNRFLDWNGKLNNSIKKYIIDGNKDVKIWLENHPFNSYTASSDESGLDNFSKLEDVLSVFSKEDQELMDSSTQGLKKVDQHWKTQLKYSEWWISFNQTSAELKNLIQYFQNPLSSNIFEQSIIFSAPFVKISEVIKQLSIYEKTNYNSVQIMASYGILWDSAIRMPGFNLSIIAPNSFLENIQEITVDLDGENGKPLPQASNGENATDTADAANGHDGKPGNPGQSSGNFLGIFGQSSLPIEKINFKLNGGKGGNGQDGGNGGYGKNGDKVSEDKEKLYKIAEEIKKTSDTVTETPGGCADHTHLTSIVYSSHLGKVFESEFFDSEICTRSYYLEKLIVYGAPFKKSGAGGAGGVGGYGGKAGNAGWILSNQHYKFIGKDGVYGEAGKTGQCGPKVEKYELHCNHQNGFFSRYFDGFSHKETTSYTPQSPTKLNASGMGEANSAPDIKLQMVISSFRKNLTTQPEIIQDLGIEFLEQNHNF